jgi:ATP-binding cassette subfamily B protein RaxB
MQKELGINAPFDVKEWLRFSTKKKLPIIDQAESAECGLACLAMISSFHGSHLTLLDLRQKYGSSEYGVRLADIMEVAGKIDLQSRAVSLDVPELPKLKLPCVLHWQFDHFVVLKHIGKGGVVIHDPSRGEVSLRMSDFSDKFTGVALELWPDKSFLPKVEKSGISWKGLLGRTDGLKNALFQAISLALVLEMIALLTPLLTQSILDDVLADGDQSLLKILAIGFILLLVFQIAVSFLRSWSMQHVAASLTLAWTGNVYAHLLKLPGSYFSKRHVGDVVSRFSAVTDIQETITTDTVEASLDGLMGILTLGVMFLYSPLLTFFTLGIFALYFVIRLFSYGIVRQASSGQILALAKQQSVFIESLRGVQVIRGFNKLSQQVNRYLNTTSKVINKQVASTRLSIIFGSLLDFLQGAENIVVICLGARMVLRGDFSAGELLAFVAYSAQFSSRAGGLIDYLFKVKVLQVQTERLSDILLTPPETNVQGLYSGPDPASSIELSGVSFQYARGSKVIIKKLSLRVEEGECVALIGPSGCGKSTLAKIITGLLDPQEGEVRIGGIPLTHLGKDRFRNMIASVMQDDQMFSGTIASNIAFYDDGAKMQDIEASAKAAFIHDDIISLPMGYATLVGDMGSALSGGQRQRILLARALYRRPKILVLDEATSHLDIENEQKINEVIKSMSITRIMVAHRPQTIRCADRTISIFDSERGFNEERIIEAIAAG